MPLLSQELQLSCINMLTRLWAGYLKQIPEDRKLSEYFLKSFAMVTLLVILEIHNRIYKSDSSYFIWQDILTLIELYSHNSLLNALK